MSVRSLISFINGLIVTANIILLDLYLLLIIKISLSLLILILRYLVKSDLFICNLLSEDIIRFQ